MKKERDFFAIENWWDVTLFTALLFLMILANKLGIQASEDQQHVDWLLVGFILYEPLCRLIWYWTGLYEVKPEVLKTDEESKIVPLDYVKLFLGLPL